MGDIPGRTESDLPPNQRRVFESSLFMLICFLSLFGILLWIWILLRVFSVLWESYAIIQIILLIVLLTVGSLTIVGVVGTVVRSHRGHLLLILSAILTTPDTYQAYLEPFFSTLIEVFGASAEFFADIHQDIIQSNLSFYILLSGELGALTTAYSDPEHTNIYDICGNMRKTYESETDHKVSIITGREENKNNTVTELITRLKKRAQSEDGVADEDIPLLIFETLDYLRDDTLQVTFLRSRPNLHFGISDNLLYVQQRHRPEHEKTTHWYVEDPPRYLMLFHRIRSAGYYLYSAAVNTMAEYIGGKYATTKSDPTTELVGSVMDRLEEDISDIDEEERRRRIGSALQSVPVLNAIENGDDEENIYSVAKGQMRAQQEVDNFEIFPL